MASAPPAGAAPPAAPQPGPARPPAAKKLARVAVFCGSAPGKSPAYREVAAALGREIAARGMGLVYGGEARGRASFFFIHSIPITHLLSLSLTLLSLSLLTLATRTLPKAATSA